MILPKTLLNVGWRYLLRHPWQSVLMVIGITLGVAVVVAVDMANASASRAFDISTETIVGRATHGIRGGPQGVDEEVFTRLVRSGILAPAAPVLSQYVTSPELGDRTMRLLGVDPFSEAPFRDYLGGGGGGASGETRPAPLVSNLTDFIVQPGAVLISSAVAERYGLQACPADASPEQRPANCQIRLEVGGELRPAYIAGLLEPSDSLSRRALEGLILADISPAQELTAREGWLNHIDLILPENDAARQAISQEIEALLPAGVRLQAVEARIGAVEQMIAAFRVNLTALSLLALVVGMFLIYNTMTFSVVQRRPLFGTLRCLGVTRREVFVLVMSEAAIMGLLGALLGVGLGILMGQATVSMVTQTINDLFFVLTVRGVAIPVDSLVKGALLGVTATLLTAAPPAWEAASSPPRAVLSRSGLESKARRAVRLAAWLGIGLLIAGLALLSLPTRSLVISFAGTFGVVIGLAMLAPIVTGVLMRLALPPLGRLWGTLGRMAPRNVVNSLSRTAVAVAALMVAVSVTIGVSLMVSSFRNTVITWLEQTLQGDIYISSAGFNDLDLRAVDLLRDWPGVERSDTLRAVTVDSPAGPINITASDNISSGTERIYVRRDVPEPEVWPRLQAGAVLISEPLANRLDLTQPNATLTLYTDRGPQEFPIIGVYYDYASTQGTVLMDQAIYRRLWDDPGLTAMSLRLEPGAQVDQVVESIEAQMAAEKKPVVVRANRALRQEVLVIFDRTFAITGALQILATVVAFIGVLSALLSLELERQRELGILRAIGLTVRQVWGLIMLETGLLGTVAGLLSMPTGYILALILIFIINKRSFGWTVQMLLTPEPFIQALLVAVVAALLAGLYPARRISRMLTSEVLRSE